MLLLMSLPVCVPFIGSGETKLDKLNLPDGFNIEVYAENVEGARSMVMSNDNVLYVGTRSEGNVYAIPDADNDKKGDKVITIAEDLNSPNGVALKNGDLYVAEISKVWKYQNIDDTYNKPGKKILVNDNFPEEGHHGWKYIAFGPDGKLYVPVGAPCNICNEDSSRYANIMRMNPDGSDLEPFAFGVRNTVGFDWHPKTKELFFTDNGRDWLGDNKPGDELNHAPEKGMHFGYPFCHAGNIPDPEYGEMRDCSEFTKPVQTLGPHVAALGMLFYTGDMFPDKYKNNILIAEHGSWNRSEPIGYRLSFVPLDNNYNSKSYDIFADGWLQGNSAWGRPVDIIQLDDGSILVSDDYADAIYRITYKK